MPASPNSWRNRSRPRASISASSTSSRAPVRSSRPRPISAPIAGATPTTPISAPSAASAARSKCCSSPRCSTRPAPASESPGSETQDTLMAKEKPAEIKVKAFGTHYVITQPNPLRKVLRRVDERDLDDPVARAEAALAGLSGEFRDWMLVEADRLSAAHAAILKNGFSEKAAEELFRAAHDIKGDAATFGYPSAAVAAESLCRIIEHAPELEKVPAELIKHHINAVQAIVHNHTRLDSTKVATELSRKLRGVADKYLMHVNRDRPEHLEAIMAPSIVPAE